MNFLNNRIRRNSTGKFCKNKINNLENIKLAQFSLKTISYFGILRPKSITSFRASRLYNIYSIIILLHKYCYSITILINICQNRHKLDIFIESMFFFTSTLLIAFKMTYLKLHQQDLISFINLSSKKKYLPRNNEEALIYEKFRYKERLVIHPSSYKYRKVQYLTFNYQLHYFTK